MTKPHQKVAVWDTYVKCSNGSVLHFDIIVPDHLNDAAQIYAFGREYLSESGKVNLEITSRECRFYHIEEPSAEILNSITETGYFILEMEEIPDVLPSSPTRRDRILHLRAHYPEWRFADFGGKSDEEVRLLLQKKTNE